jgi:hypothetical protein
VARILRCRCDEVAEDRDSGFSAGVGARRDLALRSSAGSGNAQCARLCCLLFEVGCSPLRELPNFG